MYHNHTNSVCIYMIQIVINKQFFASSYWFNYTYKDTFSFMPLKYAVGLLKCRPWLCTIYNPAIFQFSLAFRQCTTLLLYFGMCISVVSNFLTIHIYAYFMYIGPGASNHYSCKRVQHTPSILYICRIRPLCQPCKTTQIHVIMTMQFYVSSHSHKNKCWIDEYP